MSPPPLRFECGTCGKVLEVPADAAGVRTACPQCGEPATAPGEPVGDAFDDGMTGPAEVTLGSVFRAAWADWKTHLRTLAPAAFLAVLVWFAGTVTAAFAIGLAVALLDALGAHTETMVLAGVWLWLAAASAVGGLLGHAFAGGCLEAARGGVRIWGVMRSPRLGRAALCMTLAGLFAAGLVAGPVWLAASAHLSGLIGPLTLGSLLLVPPALFVLFWPVAFLIHERPELRHVRPLFAAVRLGAGRWGGHVAVGLAAYVLTATGPLALLGATVLLFGLGGGIGPTELLGVLVLGTPLLPFTAPLGGLMLAHAFLRGERGRADTGEAGPLDPEGVF